MSRKDYECLAAIVGGTLAVAAREGGEDNRTAIYDVLYRPLVAMLQADNPAFDNLRFAGAVGTHELAWLARKERFEPPIPGVDEL